MNFFFCFISYFCCGHFSTGSISCFNYIAQFNPGFFCHYYYYHYYGYWCSTTVFQDFINFYCYKIPFIFLFNNLESKRFSSVNNNGKGFLLNKISELIIGFLADETQKIHSNDLEESVDCCIAFVFWWFRLFQL